MDDIILLGSFSVVTEGIIPPDRSSVPMAIIIPRAVSWAATDGITKQGPSWEPMAVIISKDRSLELTDAIIPQAHSSAPTVITWSQLRLRPVSVGIETA